MNLMPNETLQKLRTAWEKGLSTRSAAREVGVNRNTCTRYFALWTKDSSSLDPYQRDDLRGSVADPLSSDLFCIVQPELKQALIEQARIRRTSLNHFVGFLLEVIVEDNLIPAIMEETGDDAVAEAMPLKRKCLCCGGGFFSAHKYNRLCRECTEQWHQEEGRLHKDTLAALPQLRTQVEGMEATLRLEKRKSRDLKRHLTTLTLTVLSFLERLDHVMRGPSTPERGKKIADLSNALDLANDVARYGGLKINFRDDDKKIALANAQRTAADQFAEVLREWWAFDDGQHHTHSWHTREDFIKDTLPSLLAPSPSLQDEREGKFWRHKKRGSIVREVGRGFAQVAAHPIEEMSAVVIYEHDGNYWVRNAVEFDDGRFEPIEAPAVPTHRDRIGGERNGDHSKD